MQIWLFCPGSQETSRRYSIRDPPYGYCADTTCGPHCMARKMIAESIPFKDIKTRRELNDRMRSLNKISGRTPTWLALEEAKKMYLTKSRGSRSVTSVCYVTLPN